jgi:hypothetical protein
MNFVWIILRRDLKSLFSVGPSGRFKRIVGMILGVAFFLGFGIGLTYVMYKGFTLINSMFEELPALARGIEVNLLGSMGIFAVVILLMTGFQHGYKVMYESRDIDFLMVQPVPTWAVFASKYFTAFVSQSLMTATYGLPAFIAFGLANRLGVYYYFKVILGMFLLLLLGHALIAWFLLFAMRRLQGRKMKQLFVAISAIFGVVIVLMSQILSARVTRVEDPKSLLMSLSEIELGRQWYLPTTWMINYILGGEVGLPNSSLRWGSLLLVSALGISYLAIRVSETWFFLGWTGRSEESPIKSRRIKKRVSTAYVNTSNKFSGDYWTILRKDLRMLFREPLVWYSLVISIVVLGFYIYNLRSQGTADMGDTPIGPLLLMMSSLMGSVSSSQTGGISLSMEGQSFWIVRSNPVSPKGLFGAKLTYAILPTAFIILLSLVSASVLGFSSTSLWVGIPTGISMATVIGVFQLLLDVYYPDFALRLEFGAAKTGKGTAKLLITMFASIAISIFLFLILMLPPIIHSGRVFPWMTMETLTNLSYAAIIGLGVISLVIGLYLGERRLAKILRDL